jgi:DnaJ-class molecular chaperone
METVYVECPNCSGSGREGEVPLIGGKTMKGKCVFCAGSGSIPEWDLERIRLMVIEKKTVIQMSLQLNGGTNE